MKTLIVLEVEHAKPNPVLADLIASRAWSIDGVSKVEVFRVEHMAELESSPAVTVTN